MTLPYSINCYLHKYLPNRATHPMAMDKVPHSSHELDAGTAGPNCQPALPVNDPPLRLYFPRENPRRITGDG